LLILNFDSQPYIRPERRKATKGCQSFLFINIFVCARREWGNGQMGALWNAFLSSFVGNSDIQDRPNRNGQCKEKEN